MDPRREPLDPVRWALSCLVFDAALLALILLAVLSGCAAVSRETVAVNVPVAVRAAPPAELTAPLAVDPLPAFVAPTDAHATSALTADGERHLQQLLLTLHTRLRAWSAWATPDPR